MRGILLAGILISLVGVSSAQDESAMMKLDREEVVNLGSTLVLRLSLTIPGVPEAEMTRMQYAFRHAPGATKEFSSDEWNGIWPRGGVLHAEVLIVAQVARESPKHPPMLMLTVQQNSGASGENKGSYSFYPVPLEKDRTLEDLIEINVEPGEYPVGERIGIGRLGVDPIYLSVEAEPEK
jgi:hypothetical protein